MYHSETHNFQANILYEFFQIFLRILSVIFCSLLERLLVSFLKYPFKKFILKLIFKKKKQEINLLIRPIGFYVVIQLMFHHNQFH